MPLITLLPLDPFTSLTHAAAGPAGDVKLQSTITLLKEPSNTTPCFPAFTASKMQLSKRLFTEPSW
ncbi:hypothetical protein DF052_26515 [Burkholderia glumae]|nr:hypothetical protein DF052_26515 [Burkholderia glumae]